MPEMVQGDSIAKMNLANEKQHYISKVLLNRFKIPGSPLQCYQIEAGLWKPRSVENVCSSEGYNQLLVPGEDVNNSLEWSISRVESRLPKTFGVLESAANATTTELPKTIYENWCQYCAFLGLSSLFAKASAVVSFVQQLNMELKKGDYYLWRELTVPEETITGFRQEYLEGGRVIIEADNVLQLAYRLQFERLLNINYSELYASDWTATISPFDLPMSDIGLIQIHLTDLKAKWYLLPIGPKHLLEGIFFFDASKNPSKTVVHGHILSAGEAEQRFDCICGSGVREIICSSINPAVTLGIMRAKANGISFNKIVNPDLITAAGAKSASRKYNLRAVSVEEYKQFVHSFVIPPTFAPLPASEG